MNKGYLVAALISTALTACYYCWLIPAWIHLDDPPKSISRKSNELRQTIVSKEKDSSGGYKTAFDDHNEVRLPMPNEAYFIQEPQYRCASTLKINTSKDASYVIKVVDPYNNEVIEVFFLPAGVSLEVDIPIGRFEIRYTCGTKWYGEKEMFGADASYARADRYFDFSEELGHELTLYRVRDGNLSTSKMRKEDF